MKKTLLAAALVAVAVPAPLALAGPGERAPDRHAGEGAREASSARPDHAGPGRRGRGPALVGRGTIASVDAAAGTLELTLTGGNRPLRRITGGTGTLTVTLDVETVIDRFTTRIRVAGTGRATVADIAPGARVVVTWRAPRGTTAAELAEVEAHRVVARAPRPAAVPGADGATPDDGESSED